MAQWTPLYKASCAKPIRQKQPQPSSGMPKMKWARAGIDVATDEVCFFVPTAAGNAGQPDQNKGKNLLARFLGRTTIQIRTDENIKVAQGTRFSGSKCQCGFAKSQWVSAPSCGSILNFSKLLIRKPFYQISIWINLQIKAFVRMTFNDV